MSRTERPSMETAEERRRRAAKRAYLDALPKHPEFVLPNDKIDGLLPSAKVVSWEELLKILQGPDFKKTKNDLVYRGHAGHDWQLSSTLGRLFDGGDIPSDKRTKLLRQFKLSMRGRGYDLGPLQTEEEIWAVGQHNGLKTPLLDWTRSPFVALFFAFSKYQNQTDTENNPSRALFCMNKTKLEEDLGEDFVDELFLEPEDHRNSRLVNQSGLFTIAPDGQDNLVSLIVNRLDDAELLGSVDETSIDDGMTDFIAAADAALSQTTVEGPDTPQITFSVSDRKRAKLLARYVFKLHIPNSINDRKGCLEALRQMNIHHGNLFPDPGGASEFCNDWLERLLEDEKFEVAEEEKKQDDRKIAAALKTERTVDIAGDVSNLLSAFLVLETGEERDFAQGIENAVQQASSLDWQKFPSKRIVVKRAIAQAIARGPGDIKADRKIDDLIDLLLKKYSSAEETTP
ncbi:FRG domain-containing protein [Sedimentitalea todarodis]|uniref:FRG domain-containing protein n=1 Tax=Sedimentitalea todarodis TaxID=1631240 RepID=A0ABU3V8B9_9RHOB|nr:FRG domain-containing protein [Sedimentitalea todarodis]MDU9002404.1 FRG domain-containing protein [Sedimentitalea todarodis]